MNKVPLISVCITAYQHESFIEETINSVLSQKVDADIEIIVGVEPSDNRDRTVEIVKEMAAQYPSVIKVAELSPDAQHIYMNGNKTGRANFINTFSFAKGDYVCYVDGDDVFARTNKLQIQLTFLEEHPEIVVVSHAHITERELGDKAVYWRKIPTLFTLRIICKGTFFHLSACMYRNIFKGELPFDFTLEGTGDLYLLMQYLRFGNGFYYPILGSRYRVHTGGIYSGVSRRAKRKRMIRNLTVYADTGYFGDNESFLRSRAKQIALSREYEIYCRRKKHIAKICFLFRNRRFLMRKLRKRYRFVFKLLRLR